MIRARSPVIVFVTDARIELTRTIAIVRAVAAAIGPRGLLVQLRDKEGDPADIRSAAEALRRETRTASALFVVNGSPSLARDVEADGVHLPGDRSLARLVPAQTPGPSLASRIAAARDQLGEDAIITAAAHDDADIQAAIAGGATAALVSPIFPSPGKGLPRGVEAIRSARALVEGSQSPLRLYALGGVAAEHACSCAKAGAHGVAVIRALYEAWTTGEVGCAAVAQALAGPFGSA